MGNIIFWGFIIFCVVGVFSAAGEAHRKAEFEKLRTSREVAEAIVWIVGNRDNHELIGTILLNPTDRQVLAVWERVTKNGLLDAAAFSWNGRTLAERKAEAEARPWTDLTVAKEQK